MQQTRENGHLDESAGGGAIWANVKEVQEVKLTRLGDGVDLKTDREEGTIIFPNWIDGGTIHSEGKQRKTTVQEEVSEFSLEHAKYEILLRRHISPLATFIYGVCTVQLAVEYTDLLFICEKEKKG